MLSTQLILLNYPVILPLHAAPQFLQKLTPFHVTEEQTGLSPDYCG